MHSTLTEAKFRISQGSGWHVFAITQTLRTRSGVRSRDEVYLDRSDIPDFETVQKARHTTFWALMFVERHVGANAYHLCLPKSMSPLHPVFPVVNCWLHLLIQSRTIESPPLDPHFSWWRGGVWSWSSDQQSQCSEDNCNTSFNGRATATNTTVGRYAMESTPLS